MRVRIKSFLLWTMREKERRWSGEDLQPARPTSTPPEHVSTSNDINDTQVMTPGTWAGSTESMREEVLQSD